MSLYNDYNNEIQRRLIDKFENDKDANRDKKTIIDNLMIYSLDRNWWNSQEKTFNYNLQFDNANNNFSILKQFRNIKSIYIDTLILPNFYNNLLDLHGALSSNLVKIDANGTNESANNIISFERLSDLPFISINVNEFGNNIYGTNNNFNESSAIMILDSVKPLTNKNSGSISYSQAEDPLIFTHGNFGNSLIPGNNLDSLVMKNLSKKKIYSPNKSTLSNLNISFHKPDGEEITLINNILSLKSIIYTASDKSLLITTNEYFSPEEYRIGCVILIKNLPNITSELNDIKLKNINLSKFLEREKGHTIINFGTATNAKFYNQIRITIDHQLNKTTGLILNNLLNLANNDTFTYSDTSGKLININNQHTISMIIETDTYINSFNSKLL